MKKKKKAESIIIGSELFQMVIVAIILFGFWLMISGQFSPRYLIVGAVTSVAVTFITRPLLHMPSTKSQSKIYLPFCVPYFRIFKYMIWLFREIVKANIYMIKIILDPKMPIDPVIVKFKKRMDNPAAHALLGNSIALTPGTLTIEIEDDTYVIHAITKEAGETLARPDGSEAEIAKKVGGIFDNE